MSKRICSNHGVWTAIKRSDRCPNCKADYHKEYDSNQRDEDSKKFYNSRSWRRLSTRYRSNNPLCEICDEAVAELVDHIKEIKDGGCKMCEDNLQSLCSGCHNKKTADERSKRR